MYIRDASLHVAFKAPSLDAKDLQKIIAQDKYPRMKTKYRVKEWQRLLNIRRQKYHPRLSKEKGVHLYAKMGSFSGL